MSTEIRNLDFKNKNFIFLAILVIITICVRLYFLPSEIPFKTDAIEYFSFAFEISSSDLFNIENNTNSSNENLTSANLYLNGFTISQDGTIDIPNVGKVYILNQTIDEAKETILKVAKDYLINPFVIVKLANRPINRIVKNLKSIAFKVCL